MLRSFSFSENSTAPASPCLRDVPSPASLVFTPAHRVNCESDLEKLEEGAVQKGAVEEGAVEGAVGEGALEEGAVEEGFVERGALEEGVVVGKSDQEDVEDDEQHRNRMIWIKRLDERIDDSALKSRLLESLEEIYWTPYSVLPTVVLRPVKDQLLEGVLTPVQFLGKLQNLLEFAKM